MGKTDKLICSVYKSLQKDEMYLYVDKRKGIKDLPEPLLKLFGAPKLVVDMLLTENKQLSRVDTKQVLKDIEEKGFFLQMPPADKENLLAEHRVSLGLDPNAANNHGS